MKFFLFAILLVGVSSFTPHLTPRFINYPLKAQLRVENDEKCVGLALCDILEEEYKASVAARGKFIFCISGGSMVKMLSYLNPDKINWKDCTMGFVSHRCVPLDDDGSTYHKALPAFLQSWMDAGLTVVPPSGSYDAISSAADYETALTQLPREILPFNSEGYPVFDLLLIGMGIDGHVGSIYPNIEGEGGSESVKMVVPVTEPRDKPTKISLSLTSMLAAKKLVVACAGKSAKAPLGKAEAMVRALESETETAMTFPARALRERAAWLIDQDSAVLLANRQS